MAVIVVYALAIFALCFASIQPTRRVTSVVAIVALWTLLGPILMQVSNLLVVGYLDPFWKWAATIQLVVALVASVAAVMLRATLEANSEVK